MPVSEDEFERPVQIGKSQSAMSKAEQRKSNKPIMEKRRRARINHCLNELKTLILDAMKKDPARHSKLEKADILEMTVKHLQQIQRQQLATAVATDPSVLMRFKSGFDECAAEVNRYISRLESVDNGVKQRLAAHLHRCVSSIQQISGYPHQTMFSTLTQNCDKPSLVLPNVPTVPGDVNNNSNQNTDRIQIPSGLHLIPSRLPTGELALLVPNSNHMSTFLNAPAGATFQFPHNAGITVSSLINPTVGGSLNSNANHVSAFTAVTKNDYPSPTSTNDVIKKESNLPETEEYNHPYLDRSHFNAKVTDTENSADKFSEDHLKNFSLTEGKFKTFIKEQKVMQRASSSFQRSVADSTTSFVPLKETEIAEFKPFQVEIPNTHVKAHISISESLDEAKNSFQIQQKPNPNFTLNPNKPNYKSHHKFTKSTANSENGFSELGKSEIRFEKFLKIEPLGTVQNEETNFLRPSSSETFQNIEGMMGKFKRPLSNDSAEVVTPSSSESPSKAPRISLNVTLTDDPRKDDANHCKRISVIVEDSSKSDGRENKSEVTVNVSAQKDMWRPW